MSTALPCHWHDKSTHLIENICQICGITQNVSTHPKKNDLFYFSDPDMLFLLNHTEHTSQSVNVLG